MPDLSEITAKFTGGEWHDALVRLIRQSELERARAGRLLHDDVGQLLSVIGLRLSVFALDFQDRAPEITERTAEIQALLERAMAHTRDASRLLHSTAVDRAGLRFALETLAEQTRGDVTGEITIDFPAGLRVPGPASRALYRAGEHCLRYACGCGAATIRVKVAKRSLGWMLEVLYDRTSPNSDDELEAKGRADLLFLQYQAMRAGVSVALDDTPQGTALICVMYPAGRGISGVAE